jgi:hypothetical protein
VISASNTVEGFRLRRKALRRQPEDSAGVAQWRDARRPAAVCNRASTRSPIAACFMEPSLDFRPCCLKSVIGIPCRFLNVRVCTPPRVLMDVLMQSNQVKHETGRVAANPGMTDDGFHVIVKEVAQSQSEEGIGFGALAWIHTL